MVLARLRQVTEETQLASRRIINFDRRQGLLESAENAVAGHRPANDEDLVRERAPDRIVEKDRHMPVTLLGQAAFQRKRLVSGSYNSV